MCVRGGEFASAWLFLHPPPLKVLTFLKAQSEPCSLASHDCLTAAVLVGVHGVDQVVGLRILLNHRLPELAVLCIQLMPRQVLHNPSSQGVPQHIGGGSQTVPGKQQRRVTMKNRMSLSGKCHHFLVPELAENCQNFNRKRDTFSTNIFREMFPIFQAALVPGALDKGSK